MKVARLSVLPTGRLYPQELWKVLSVWKQKEKTRDKNLKQENIMGKLKSSILILTLNLPTTTIVAQPFNVIKWQLKFNPVA
jgi:hypothetical protein